MVGQGEVIYRRTFRTSKYGGWDLKVLPARFAYDGCGGTYVIQADFSRKENLCGDPVEWEYRVIRAFSSKDRATEWLARLPEDDLPDFETMGLKVE